MLKRQCFNSLQGSPFCLTPNGTHRNYRIISQRSTGTRQLIQAMQLRDMVESTPWALGSHSHSALAFSKALLRCLSEHGTRFSVEEKCQLTITKTTVVRLSKKPQKHILQMQLKHEYTSPPHVKSWPPSIPPFPSSFPMLLS